MYVCMYMHVCTRAWGTGHACVCMYDYVIPACIYRGIRHACTCEEVDVIICACIIMYIHIRIGFNVHVCTYMYVHAHVLCTVHAG